MELHICIFVGLFLLWLGFHKKWKIGRMLKDDKGRRLFFLVAVGGNLLGIILSVENNRERQVPKVMHREELGYEQELVVCVDGGEESRLTLQIPEKENQQEEEGPEEAKQELSLEQQVQDEILRFNQEKNDPENYYLPQPLNGRSLQWGIPEDYTGTFMSSMCLGAAAVLLVFREREKENSRKKREEELIMDYPGLVTKFTLLIQAGMSVRGAFQKISEDCETKTKDRRPGYEEVRRTCIEMDSGVSQKEAYQNFGQRCAQAKYKTFSTLLVQNLRSGNRNLVDMLERESTEAWEERKRRARIHGETAATKLLVPMILMLGVVLALLMIPACLSFYSG